MCMRVTHNCPHNSIIGDNNGFTCRICGAQISGFGCGGTFPTCIHDWYGEPHMKYKTCTYCEKEELNEKYNIAKDDVCQN